MVMNHTHLDNRFQNEVFTIKNAEDLRMIDEPLRDSYVIPELIQFEAGEIRIPVRFRFASLFDCSVARLSEGPNLWLVFRNCVSYSATFSEETNLKEFEHGRLELLKTADGAIQVIFHCHYILTLTLNLSTLNGTIETICKKQ